MDKRRSFRNDANSRCATKLLTIFLMVAILSLHVNFVASSSRPLQRLQANTINARDGDTGPPEVVGQALRSSGLRKTANQRALLQQLPSPPTNPGGGPTQSDLRVPPPPQTSLDTLAQQIKA